MNLPLSPEQMQALMANGSPSLLHMVGRAFGLGDAERGALVQGKFPGWFWAVSGVVVGVAVGIQVHKRWPNKVPKFMGGGA